VISWLGDISVETVARFVTDIVVKSALINTVWEKEEQTLLKTEG